MRIYREKQAKYAKDPFLYGELAENNYVCSKEMRKINFTLIKLSLDEAKSYNQ